MSFANRVWFNSTSAGTGTFSVGTAVTGYRTPSGASIADGTLLSYTATGADLSQWELGHGTYHASGPTFSRDTVLENSVGGTSAISFSTNPTVYCDVTKQDYVDTTYWYPITSFAGIDPTGSTDSTTGLQNAINAVPNGACILFPQGSTFLLSSTINVVSRTHIKLMGIPIGDAIVPGAVAGDSPKLLWNGTAGGTMLYFNSCFNASIAGFNFNSNVAINNYIVSDLTGGSGVTGTAFNCQCCSFINPTANINFIGVSISPTATTNQENCIVSRCNFQGFGGASLISSVGAVVNGSATLLCSNNPFISGMAGDRIRITWSGPTSGEGGGLLDTTILTYNSAGSVTLAANAPSTQSNCTVHIGQGYGVGIKVGPSQNSKHHKFEENVYLNLQYYLVQQGGSFSIRHVNGETSDFGVCCGYYLNNPNNMPGTATGLMTEPCGIDYYESEGDMIALYGISVVLNLTNWRMENSKAVGNGWIQIGGPVNISASGPLSTAPLTNQQIIQVIGGVPATYAKIISTGNNFQFTAEVMGFTTINNYQYGSTAWISVGDTWDQTQSPPMRLGGYKNFAQLTDDPQLGDLAIVADCSTTPTFGATVVGGGSFVVKAWYNGTNWIIG